MNKDFVYSSSLTSADSVSGSPYPLAIVGISCYLPDAATPEEYWRNLFNDRVSIKPACSSRFPEVFYAPDPKHEKKAQKGCSYTNLAALIDFDRFCKRLVSEKGELDPHVESCLIAMGKQQEVKSWRKGFM